MLVVPEALLARFQAIAMERLERIDDGWRSLTKGANTPSLEEDVLRDLHTLKGDARVIGMTEVWLLCQRLEELFEAARAKSYLVHDDVDIVVTMAIQFIGMLVRKQSSARRGIDIDGFMKQIEAVMSEWLRRSSQAPHERVSVGPHLRVKDHRALSASSGLRLSTSTTAVYLEHLRNTGDAQQRVHDLWTSLLAGLVEANGVALAPIVAANVSAAEDLAKRLEKRVRIEVTGDRTDVTPETLEAIGVFLVHTLSNAIDHGIELPAVRQQKGKDPVAHLDVRIEREGEKIAVTVRDDGAGIDIALVRDRAIARGLLSEAVAPGASRDQLLEYLFASGFSTREASGEISGRGLGLDAARAAIELQGGTIAIATTENQGTTFTARFLDVRGSIDVRCFEGGASDVRFAVPSNYGVRKTNATGLFAEELVRIPQTPRAGVVSLEIFDDVSHLVLRAGSRPTMHRALRRCPTADTERIEIVWVDDREVVLLRPKAFT
jgi:chemotaxis protein histidine kinase CheA